MASTLSAVGMALGLRAKGEVFGCSCWPYKDMRVFLPSTFWTAAGYNEEGGGPCCEARRHPMVVVRAVHVKRPAI